MVKEDSLPSGVFGPVGATLKRLELHGNQMESGYPEGALLDLINLETLKLDTFPDLDPQVAPFGPGIFLLHNYNLQ
jgi:hypothetical protein